MKTTTELEADETFGPDEPCAPTLQRDAAAVGTMQRRAWRCSRINGATPAGTPERCPRFARASDDRCCLAHAWRKSAAFPVLHWDLWDRYTIREGYRPTRHDL